MNIDPDPRWIELFPKSFIPDIIQDILDTASYLTLPPDDEKRPEEHITKQVYKRLTRNKRYYTGPLNPSIEHWLTDLESRTDIIFYCGKGLETYFIVEAKRLFVTFPGGRNASLVKEYIDNGVMRFINKQYAYYQQESAMLGYVFTVSCNKAREAIASGMAENREMICMEGAYAKSTLPVKPSVDETQHDADGKPFTLYHLFIRLSSPKN